jgi:hypothetical protein
MPGKSHIRAGLILFILAAATVWWGLSRMEPRAEWLRVEAPRRAVAGKPLRMRVHLAPLSEPTSVCADLHWSARRDGPGRFLASGGSRQAGKAGGDLDFEIMVPPKEGLRFVMGIIFLSPTGRWDNHTLVAATKRITVDSNTGNEAALPLESLNAQTLGAATDFQSRPARFPRWPSGLLFLAAAVVTWGALRSANGAARRWCWHLLPILLALAGLWETFGLEDWVGAHARAFARTEDVYYTRASFQKVVISVIIAGAMLFLVLVRRARGPGRLLLMVCGLYLGLAAVNLVSLHAIDQFFGLSWHGLSLMRGLKMACAAIVLWLAQGLRAVPSKQTVADGTCVNALKEPTGEE